MAATLEAEGLELARRGDTHAAATRLLEAGHLRETAEEMERLRRPRDHGTRKAVSVVQPDGERKPIQRSALRAASEAAGFSLRGLGTEVGIAHSHLSMAHAGKRPISREVARKIEELTGFKATSANWPGGLKD